jgi:hypothetical protein
MADARFDTGITHDALHLLRDFNRTPPMGMYAECFLVSHT